MHANEALERAEQTSGHTEHTSNRSIGLTMGLIGVLIAFCAAMVGSERNELTRTMIEQTQAHSDYSAASTKFRLIMIEAERQRAALTSAPSEAAAAAASPMPETAVTAATPSPSFVRRLLRLYQDYASERKLSKLWADNYGPLVDAHFEAAEAYERAQLIAEIGIVVASLAVLLSSRPAWYVSIVLAVICVAQLGRTFVHTRAAVGAAAHHVHSAEEAYQGLRKSHTGGNDDEATIDALDPAGKIRAEFGAGETAPHEH